jgi:hypothetical protein
MPKSVRILRLKSRNTRWEQSSAYIQAAENNLKQLMADVTRAMEKAQEAVARIAANAAAAPAQTESTTSSR